MMRTVGAFRFFGLLCLTGGLVAQENKPQDVVSWEDLQQVEDFIQKLDGKKTIQINRGNWKAAVDDLMTGEEKESWMVGLVLEEDSLQVQKVISGLPGEEAGLRVGDELKSLNGIKLRSFEQFRKLIQLVEDQEVQLVVWRDEEKKKIEIQAVQVPRKNVSLLFSETQQESPEEGPEPEEVPGHQEEPHHDHEEQSNHEGEGEEEILETLEGIHEVMKELLLEVRKMRKQQALQ